MEKKTPHYSLVKIKKLINSGDYRVTRSALNAAYECFSFQRQDIILLVLTVQTDHFYKSMTIHGDSAIWQDVYHARISDNIKAYIKLQIVDEKTIIISFKEK